MKQFYVYIMSNGKRGALYVGVTSNLQKRVFEHKQGLRGGFTSKYKTDMLVYHETIATAEAAFKRESQIKRWTRVKKIELVENANPEWDDLYERLF